MYTNNVKRSITWSYPFVYYLTIGLFLLAMVLRSSLLYSTYPGVLYEDLALLAVWLVLFISEPFITRKEPIYFPIFLVIQSILVMILLLGPDPSDYFGTLFNILSMRIMQHLKPRQGAICIAVFIPLIFFPLATTMGWANASAFAIIYSAGNALLGFFSLVARRASEANSQNRAMQEELRETNLQLQA